MYIGRFAPSPTGPLHFGSLIAAAGSYLDARARGGRWLVRIDDLDPPREQAGAAEGVLKTLAAFGFEWDGPVMYQSRRSAAYEQALATLRSAGLVYPCTCSRRMIHRHGRPGPYGPVYPGTCRRPANRRPDAAYSLRMLTDDRTITVDDAVQGAYSQNLERDIGDFNLKRRDGLYAYHLAAAVDDGEQGVTHIVRGHDLLESTPRQIYLQQQLNLPTPRYAHLPVAKNDRGQKLSKQTGARPLDTAQAGALLCTALAFLGHEPPEGLCGEPPEAVLEWAVREWRLERVQSSGGVHGD
jgi:glutamyl-Q tRNA(Asp) synthetase